MRQPAALAAPTGEDPPTAEFEPPPPTRTRAELLPEDAARGRPPGFGPGAPAAYWIWQGPRGGWRLRITTAGERQVFQGRLKGTSSPIEHVRAYPNELRNRVRPSSNGWAFSFATLGHAHGFSFRVRDGGCVHFDLKTDARPKPQRIFVGSRKIEPRTGHFIACPAGRKPSKRPASPPRLVPEGSRSPGRR